LRHNLFLVALALFALGFLYDQRILPHSSRGVSAPTVGRAPSPVLGTDAPSPTPRATSAPAPTPTAYVTPTPAPRHHFTTSKRDDMAGWVTQQLLYLFDPSNPNRPVIGLDGFWKNAEVEDVQVVSQSDDSVTLKIVYVQKGNGTVEPQTVLADYGRRRDDWVLEAYHGKGFSGP